MASAIYRIEEGKRRGSLCGSPLKFMVFIACLLTLGFSFACSARQEQQLHVLHMANPEYPTMAEFNNVQGTVHVSILIGADGKVMVANALFNPYPVPAEAAEKNVREWEFGPLPPDATFPIHHIITYVYTLKGPPRSTGVIPTVRTHLPDEVEIESRPLYNDFGGPMPTSPPKGTKPPRSTK